MHHYQDEIKKKLLNSKWLKKETKVKSFGVVHNFLKF